MKYFRWNYISNKNDKNSTIVIKKLSKKLNVDEVIAKLLFQRGIYSFEDAKNFFRPDLNNLHNPFLMKDMEKAVDRIKLAINNNEKILIYGDYDVDGTTSVALLYSFFTTVFKEKKDNFYYYQPDRYEEGYGISFKGIDYAHNNNISLIISLDCGIKDVDKIDYANKKKIDIIICDHHLPGEILPSAYAILDPKQKNCNYPYKELSGCGVAFKLLQAFIEKFNYSKKILFNYIDLTALSIAADIVSITGENRILTFYGLKKINNNPIPGIKMLMNIAGIKTPVTVSGLVFGLAPRINAAGRIDTATNAVKMLVSESENEAENYAKIIHTQNNERKDIDKEITQEALSMIEGNKEKYNKLKSTVLYKENWHKGVIGIVASRIIEKYYKPTIILTKSNGKITGSARSVKGFDIYSAINDCSDCLVQFGGHKYAAGLTLLPDNLDKFIYKFEQAVSKRIDDNLLIPEIIIDSELELWKINAKFYRILKQFAPFGPDNMKPVFVSKSVMCTDDIRVVGNNHLKLKVFQPSHPNISFSAIAFEMGEWERKLTSGVQFDIAYTLEENSWDGVNRIQLNIKDIKT